MEIQTRQDNQIISGKERRYCEMHKNKIIYAVYKCSVVLYGCETWSLTLREESRLRVFENKILRRIFGPKRDENVEWRRLRNEELNSLCRSPNIVRVI